MRIAYLVLNTVGKGTYWRALALARSLNGMGHDVTLVATARSRRIGIVESVQDGVAVVEAPDLFTGSLRSGWDPWNTLNRISWISGRKLDLVHAFEMRPTVLWPTLYSRTTAGVPFVSDWADWFGKGGSVEERSNALMRTALRPVETLFESGFRTTGLGVTAICTLLQQKALEIGFRESEVLLLPNGCDTVRLFPLIRDEAVTQAGLDSGCQYIGYVGTIFGGDAQLMAAAFDEVHARNPLARLLIIGTCPEDIQSMVAEPSAVIQTGTVSSTEVNLYLGVCDVCWLPLRESNANRGRMPMKLNDYMAAGRPTVATAVGDVTTLFEREQIGRLTQDEPAVMADATHALLADAEARAQFGAQARLVAETTFSWDNLADGLLEFYARMLAKVG